MHKARRKSWNYTERKRGQGSRYVIRAGDEVIGHVSSVGDADLICRARGESRRQAMQIAFEARQHRAEVLRLRDDIRVLMEAVVTMTEALKETARRRDEVAARERSHKVLRRMKARGHML